MKNESEVGKTSFVAVWTVQADVPAAVQ